MEKTNIQQQNIKSIEQINEKYSKEYNLVITESKKVPQQFEKARQVFVQTYQQVLKSTVESWHNTYKFLSKQYQENADKYDKEILLLQKEIEKKESELIYKQEKIEEDIETKEHYLYNQILEIEELKNKLLCYKNIELSNHLKRILIFK